MKKKAITYQVTYLRTVQYVASVEADSPEEAVEMVRSAQSGPSSRDERTSEPSRTVMNIAIRTRKA